MSFKVKRIILFRVKRCSEKTAVYANKYKIRILQSSSTNHVASIVFFSRKEIREKEKDKFASIQM